MAPPRPSVAMLAATRPVTGRRSKRTPCSWKFLMYSSAVAGDARRARPQPRVVHAPHDGELESTRAGDPQPEVLRRVGDTRVDGPVAGGGQSLGGKRLRGTRAVLRDRGGRTGSAGSRPRALVGQG